MSKTLDKAQLVVIGAGPGGYAAAFKAADLGLDVTIVEPEANPGGVCLHRGCIPSKAFLHAAKLIREAEESHEMGVTFGKPKIDVPKLRAWKDGIVETLTGGLGGKVKHKKIRHVRGRARFHGPKALTVELVEGGEATLEFEQAILATGSRPALPPFVEGLSERIIDSTGALDPTRAPTSLLVIGGGYIGLELGCVYAALGTAVTVVEMLPQIMTGADKDLVSQVKRRLDAQFEAILLNTKVLALKEQKNGVKVTLEDRKGEQTTKIYDQVLVSVGRRPNTEDLGLEAAGIALDGPFVKVDALRRTTADGVFAIGDITGQPMLAHKATAEGHVAAEVAAGRTAAFEPRCIPAVCFTDPEVAWAGLTEIEAKERGIKIKTTKIPWRSIGRTLTLGRDDGMTKVIIDPETDRVLGVGLAGPGAGELISEAALAIEMAARWQDLALTIHPHPTLSESIMEAADGFFA
ncbi:MAG TPA: dihydrolipoyl dehydrogenase [Candidatus Krumholzibacteria bacterium]|nr:dihydrolipoyl dehydrogenase [Candidatus Krumholzibacteria bacterium]HRX49847.1 dihydrolipoyl dehydrogenase [Candidatus Krumholzibacteria bacterium]